MAVERRPRCVELQLDSNSGLRPCRSQHSLGGKVLLDGLLDERAVDPPLAELTVEALRAIATAGQTGGEVGVRIGRIVQDTTGREWTGDVPTAVALLD